jgi:hypothetical protein
MIWHLGIAAAFGVAAFLANAARADLVATYDVELKTFKKQAAGGDPLVFQLYPTPDCSGDFVETGRQVGGADVSIEEVRPLAIKGVSPRPKKLARLTTRLPTGSTSVPRSLEVVLGASTEPLAGCQPQGGSTVLVSSPYWVSAYEFDGPRRSVDWFHSSAGGVACTDAGRACLVAPIRLPDGAFLDGFEAYVRDDQPGESIDFRLYANPLADQARVELAAGSSVDMAGTQIVDGAPTAGIVNRVVDNAQFHYYVEFCFGGAGVPFGSHDVWAVAVQYE